jgi:hypothetical protein
MASRVLLAAALALAATPTLAAPPSAGSRHTFHDPVFNGTVFCDTLDEVWAIATADAPNDVYARYNLTTNDQDEPICMAIVPTGVVVDVTPIGVMERSGHQYNAWAVETDVGGVTAFALYLELFVSA